MVSVADETSPNVRLHFAVPQRSVLCPNNYCMYVKPVGEIIKRHNVRYQCYADDTHLQLKLALKISVFGCFLIKATSEEN